MVFDSSCKLSKILPEMPSIRVKIQTTLLYHGQFCGLEVNLEDGLGQVLEAKSQEQTKLVKMFIQIMDIRQEKVNHRNQS